MDLQTRRRAADDNVAAAFGLTRDYFGDPRAGGARFGPVEAIATGIESAFFNLALVFEPTTRVEDVLAAVDWVEARGLPVSVHVRDDVGPEVGSALVHRSFEAGDWQTPVMVLELIPPRPRPQPDGVALRVGGAELHEDFHLGGESGELFRRIFGPGFLADSRVRIAAAYLDGEPVAGAAVIRSGQVVGVYAVATQERARRRGIGRAVTWAAIDAGREAWSGTIAVLQSSEMGVPAYRSMGFEEVSRYTVYQKPRPAAADEHAAAEPKG